MRILIIGAGGHGRVVADALLRASEIDAALHLIGFLDANPALGGGTQLGVPILGGLEMVESLAHDAVVVAIGDNGIRRRIAVSSGLRERRHTTVRHPTTTVAPDVVVEAGCMLLAGAVVNTGTRIGRGCIVNTGSVIEHDCVIGDWVHVAPRAVIGGQVMVGAGALIGIGATVMPGRRIGDGAIVGAGAVVTADVPAGTVVVGVPARPLAAR